MLMLTLTSAVEKRLPDSTSTNLPDGVSSTRTGRGRKTSPVVPIRNVLQSIPVPGVSRPIEVKIASCESEWEQAFALAAASYQERGYETPGTSRLRFTPYHALPDTVTLVAKHEGAVIATLSIVQDNKLLGLPMEDVYAEEINLLRGEGRRLFEVTTLADAGLGVREFVQVFVALIQLATQFHTSHGGDTGVIAVNPRHRQFYTKMLGFLRLGPRRSYAAVQDHPAEAFWVDEAHMRDNNPRMYEAIFGQPLPWEALWAPKLPRSFIRTFSQQSRLCDANEIERILSHIDSWGSPRRW
jgi:hypothetical protein